MPLIKGKSKGSFEKNLETEMHHGHPLKQSLAIAYAQKRAAEHKSHGGFVEEEKASGYEPCMHCARGGYCPVHGENMAHGGMLDKKPAVEIIMHAPKKMAHGGEMKYEEEEEEKSSGYRDMPEGGEKHNMMAEDEDEDMLDRIMRQHYSEGGRVANEDHGHNDDRLADFDQNEFDDLSKRDNLDFSYNGDNSGDHIGDAQEDEDQRDIVSRIMRSRKKMDKMPIVGYGTTYGKNK